MTGIVTASWIPLIIAGSDIRATPPSLRMSAGTRSSAITAQAPASSAIRACSGVTTSMITPPFSISARPVFSRKVPCSATEHQYKRASLRRSSRPAGGALRAISAPARGNQIATLADSERRRIGRIAAARGREAERVRPKSWRYLSL